MSTSVTICRGNNCNDESKCKTIGGTPSSLSEFDTTDYGGWNQNDIGCIKINNSWTKMRGINMVSYLDGGTMKFRDKNSWWYYGEGERQQHIPNGGDRYEVYWDFSNAKHTDETKRVCCGLGSQNPHHVWKQNMCNAKGIVPNGTPCEGLWKEECMNMKFGNKCMSWIRENKAKGKRFLDEFCANKDNEKDRLCNCYRYDEFNKRKATFHKHCLQYANNHKEREQCHNINNNLKIDCNFSTCSGDSKEIKTEGKNLNCKQNFDLGRCSNKFITMDGLSDKVIYDCLMDTSLPEPDWGNDFDTDTIDSKNKSAADNKKTLIFMAIGLVVMMIITMLLLF